MFTWTRHLFLMGAVALLSACASVKVSPHKEYPKPPPGKSMVYIYREEWFQGWMTRQNIWVNEAKPVKIGALKNGSYFYKVFPPGKHTIFVNGETRSSVSIEMKPGQTYYVSCNINMGFWSARPKLSVVSDMQGEVEIQKSEMEMTVQ